MARLAAFAVAPARRRAEPVDGLVEGGQCPGELVGVDLLDLDGAEALFERGEDLTLAGVVVELERGGRLDRELDRLQRSRTLIYSLVPTTCWYLHSSRGVTSDP
jgi:hypothetical protein